MFENLIGKTVLITGGSRGIGNSIVRKLAQYGLNIAMTYNEHEIDLLEIKKDCPYSQSKIKQYKLNLSSKEEIDTLVQKVEKDFGNIDFLINNAGVIKDGYILFSSEESWDKVHSIDLKGTFLLSKAVLPIMMKNKNGAIINISSVAGLTGVCGQTNYCAAKAGVIGFTRALAKEVAHKNIRVNSIAPGYVDTDMVRSVPKKVLDSLNSGIPLKRMADPDEIASVALFLLSDGASYITGTTITVDGGLTS